LRVRKSNKRMLQGAAIWRAVLNINF